MKLIDILAEAQNYMANEYPQLNSEDELTATQIVEYKQILRTFVEKKKYEVDEKQYQDLNDLVERLYWDMKEYGPLTPYLRDDILVEELQINRWYDFKTVSAENDGIPTKAKHQFLSAEHCKDIMVKVVNSNSENTSQWDVNMPIKTTSVGKNNRCTALGWEVIDEYDGVVATIRRVNQDKISADDLKNSLVNQNVWDLLFILCRYGISHIWGGATNAGKTTAALILQLEAVPNWKRWHTIETGIREFNTIKRDANGNVINNSCNFKTKEVDDPKKCIGYVEIMKASLTMDPDVDFLSECKGPEAATIYEYALSGHQAITTLHTKSAAMCPKRMADMAVGTGHNGFDVNIAEVFPINSWQAKLGVASNTRRMMEITENVMSTNSMGIRVYEPVLLYHYEVDEYIYNEWGYIVDVKGRFVKDNEISKELQQELIRNGCPKKELYEKVLSIPVNKGVAFDE